MYVHSVMLGEIIISNVAVLKCTCTTLSRNLLGYFFFCNPNVLRYTNHHNHCNVPIAACDTSRIDTTCTLQLLQSPFGCVILNYLQTKCSSYTDGSIENFPSTILRVPSMSSGSTAQFILATSSLVSLAISYALNTMSCLTFRTHAST